MKYEAELEQGEAPDKAPTGRECKYPFRECKVGYNFFVAGKNSHQIGPIVAYWNKVLAPARFTVRSRDKNGNALLKAGEVGVRVYRVM